MVLHAEEMRERLESFVGIQDGIGDVRIENVRSMPGGASKETWALDVFYKEHGREHAQPMILRLNRASPLPVAIQPRQEFTVLEAAYREGIPVPRPFWFGDDSLSNPFYLVERIEGETIARRLLRDDDYARARQVVPLQLARILAGIHRIPVEEHGLHTLPKRSQAESPARGELEFYEELFLRLAPEPHPALELGIRWLKEHAPKSDEQVLVHGDYRLGNVMFGPEGVRAILDWELAHLGDPMEDLGWISVRSWRFGNDAKPIGGMGDREDFYQAYSKAGGYPLDRARINYWEIFGNLKWGIICILQAIPFLEGTSKSIELGSLGRRTAEMELELLNLIEG